MNKQERKKRKEEKKNYEKMKMIINIYIFVRERNYLKEWTFNVYYYKREISKEEKKKN